MSRMNPGKEFGFLYANVSASIGEALSDIAELKVDHEQGKKEIGNMMDRLRGIQTRFDDDLRLLERYAEWDKFTIAFFGETNAGKSTVLESLRILFKEESRQQLLKDNANDLSKYEQALSDQVRRVREQIQKICASYVAEVESIRQSASALTLILQKESEARARGRILVAGCAGIFFGGVLGAVLANLLGA